MNAKAFPRDLRPRPLGKLAHRPRDTVGPFEGLPARDRESPRHQRAVALRQLVDAAAILAELECDPAMGAPGRLLRLAREAAARRS